jgi:hypothetical protein
MAKTITRSNLQNLPGIFRTEDNERFINSTLDQLTEKGQSEAINGYIGRKDSINFQSSDIYIDSAETDRFNYQLEPGITYVDEFNEYKLYKTYDDFLNQIKNLGGYTNNHNRLFNGVSYAYAPPIDFDKFANFREYYWLKSGPDPIIVKGSDDSTVIDIDYILARTTYTSPNGVIFSNGLKVRFEGDILQSEYKDNEYYVEGVGIKIKLIAVKDLLITESYSETSGIPFDSFLFDTVPFDQSKYVSSTPDYLTINRSSIDKNAWARGNRWFHKEIIEYTAEKNGYTPNLNEGLRAKRPIIEFESGLKLYNHGIDGVTPIDLIDFKETNAFNSVSGQTSFYVDGKQLDKGDTVIFAADTNLAVRSKIYTVDKVAVNGVTRIQLIEKTAVAYNNSINIKQGSTRAGKTYYYSIDNTYKLSQQKTKVNQAPLFDLYDSDSIILNDSITYPASTFEGNKIFSYADGTGTNDGVLGFPLKYQNIGNFGDIVFESCLHTDTYTYTINNVTSTTNAYKTFFKKYSTRLDSSLANGWKKQSRETRQPVIKFYTVQDELKVFEIDHYKDAAILQDLEITVYVDGAQKLETTDYQYTYSNSKLFLVFNKNQTIGSSIKIVAHSPTGIKNKGFYPTPINLNNNSLNATPLTFTFGEIQAHIATASNGVPNFRGTFPGSGNLRDLGELAKYSGSIVQHENAIPLAMFHTTNNNFEFDQVIFYAAKEYEKFKKSILDLYNRTESQKTIRETVDFILKEFSKNKNSASPFYNSDMVAYGSNKQSNIITIIDPATKLYPIFDFYDDTTPANKALYVYVNDVLCVEGSDYVVSSTDTAIQFIDSFVLNANDKVLIVWYSDTSGCFVPPTPTKLGIWPKYEPKKYTDDTIVNSDSSATLVIQGHDGSVIRAYGDDRDDVILEIEKRIYNNLKCNFESNTLDLADVRPGKYRNTQYTKTEYNTIYKNLLLKFINDNDIDITINNLYDQSNPFTFSYRGFKDAGGEAVDGYWRGIYKYYYDTDRPHTHPWEMLGYSVKPTWWDTTYGAAPYTSGNTYMWTDLKNGYKRGEAKTETKYARSGLLSYIPTDSNGALRNPLDIGLIGQFPAPDPQGTFVEGDHGPGETVFRRSSMWPFYAQLILAVTKPAKYFSLYFDPSRNKINSASQYVYSDTGKRFALKDLVMDMRSTPAYGKATNGYHVLVNEHLIAKGLDPHTDYHVPLKDLSLNLIWRAGGFLDKDSVDFILNSHSSTNSLFIPKEDFDILFYISKPVKTYEYSGAIVEKTSTGWKVRGYSQNPYFTYYPIVESKITGTESIGSISESVVQWQPKTFYGQGQAIQKDQIFYRSKKDFISGSAFDTSNVDQIPSLSKTGGITIKLYSEFQKDTKQLAYGTEFRTIQEVINFLLGYQQYLETQGFKFNNFIEELNTVSDWTLSAKELAYWSLQNWTVGSVLALSPASRTLEIQNNEGYVQAYDSENYEILKQDGSPLSLNKLNIKRLNQQFTLSSESVTEGIYYAKIKTRLKEHCVVFENSTVFNYILFEIRSGARQTRLKVQGFRTANWNGDLYAPGFIFDKASIEQWSSIKTYYPGDLVTYQNKTYTANRLITAEPDFDFEKWDIVNQKPEGKLLPNFDTKAEQFRKFYDLEINNFDADQEKFATHLYGYQPRQYLSNLLIDNTAQYKFYQGYIREKGSINSLNKLLRSQAQGDEPDIQTYEQWLFRQGEFGAVDTKELLEISLDSNKFLTEKTLVKLLDNGEPRSSLQDIVSLERSELYSEPFDYTSNHFGINPALYNSSITYNDLTDRLQKIKTAGYVDPDEVEYKVLTEDQIQTIDVTSVKQGDAIWVAIKKDRDWEVLRLVRKKFNIINVELVNDNDQIEYTCDFEHNLSVGDIVYIQNVTPNANGIKTVSTIVSPTQFQIDVANITALAVDNSTRLNGRVLRWEGVRYNNMDELEKINIEWDNGDVIYVDNDTNNKWIVYQKQNPYTLVNLTANDTTPEINFGTYVDGIESGDIFAVSAPGLGAGVVNVYSRGTTSDQELIQAIQPSLFSGEESLFRWGTSFAFNNDATELVIGGPTSLSGGNIVVMRRGNDGLWTRNQEFYSTSNIGSTGSFGESVSVATPSATQKFIVASDPTHNRINIYKYSSSNDYEYNQQLSLGSRDDDFQFGKKVALSEDGHWLAVSAPQWESLGSEDSSTNKGAVYIYKRGDDSSIATDDFFLVQTITPDFRLAGDKFGNDIALSKDGTTLAIGAALSNNDDSSQDFQQGGKVYIYTKSNNTFTLSQTLRSRNPEKYEQFGNKVALSKDGSILTVQSKNGTYIQPTDFDVHKTYAYPFAGEDSTIRYQLTRGSALNETPTTFDNGATRFTDPQITAGRVYVYKKYNSKWIYDNELKSTAIQSADNFGSGMAITNNKIVIGASNDDTSGSNTGLAFSYVYSENGWKVIRQQPETINVDYLYDAYVYDNSSNVKISRLEFFDPIKKKFPSIITNNIRYFSDEDPAQYNIDDSNKEAWRDSHVGEIWWDLSQFRYIDYEQSNIEFKKTWWGRPFDGAKVKILEWIKSSYTPTEYNRIAQATNADAFGVYGIPKDGANTKYSTVEKYDPVSGQISNSYYFWVENPTSVPNVQNRTIAASEIAEYIQDPQQRDNSWIAIVNQDEILLNGYKYLVSGTDRILAIESSYDPQITTNLHTEWQLIGEGNPQSLPSGRVLKKFKDSLIGYDTQGNKVPDPKLKPSLQYGIRIRPRQSWFADRNKALKEIIVYANDVLKKQRVVGSFNISNLSSGQSKPSQSQYNQKVSTVEALNFLNAESFDSGYKVLVENDSTIGSFWNLYQWSGIRWTSIQQQTWSVTRFWEYVDWYADGYDNTIVVEQTFNSEKEFSIATINTNEIVKINNDGSGKWAIRIKNADGTFTDIGAESGTIQFKSSIYDYTLNKYGYAGNDSWDNNNYDAEPTQETKIILDTLYENIFSGTLSIHANKIFFLAVKYAILEQRKADWVVKSSFIDAKNTLSSLDNTSVYKADDQSYFEEYIKEIKPYKTKIKNFVNAYDGSEIEDGIFSDFDNPPIYDYVTKKYRPTDLLLDDDSTVWNNYPHKLWKDNYAKSVDSIIVADGGVNYREAPVVTISGGGGTGATATAKVANGKLQSITVTNGGSGYVTTPTVTLTGGAGSTLSVDGSTILYDDLTAARVYPVLENRMVRDIKTTMKFDRITTGETITTWAANTAYTTGQYIVHSNVLYSVTTGFTSTSEFDDTNLTRIAHGNLQNAIDRIYAFYQPTANQSGLDYSLLMQGIAFPGVSVTGQKFSEGIGWDGAGWSSQGWDTWELEDGVVPVPTDDTIDTNLTGGVMASALGTASDDIIADGQDFKSPEHNGGPEELLPGQMFDTLDIQVYHAPVGGTPVITTNRYEGDGSTQTFSLTSTPYNTQSVFATVAGVVKTPGSEDSTTEGGDITVDVENKTVTFSTAPADGAVIDIKTMGVGGRNIVAMQTFTGDGSTVDFTVKADYYNVTASYVTVNGVKTAVTLSSVDSTNLSDTVMTFSTAPANNSVIQATLFSAPDSTTSFAEVEVDTFLYDGSTRTFTLDRAPSIIGPLHAMVVVTKNGSRMTPPDTVYYTADGSTSSFLGPDDPNTVSNLSEAQIEVHVNGTRKLLGSDYYWIQSAGLVNFNTTPSAGDVVAITAKSGHDYEVIDNTIEIQSSVSMSANDKIAVYSFTNHDDLEIRTEVFAGTEVIPAITGYDVDDYDRDGYDTDNQPQQIITNKILLSRDIIDNSYVWMSLNGTVLVGGVDFRINENDPNELLILKSHTFTASDRIVVTYFSEVTSLDTIAFRIFKDMMNRHHYRRIADSGATTLTQALNITDTHVYVADASKLPNPDPTNNRPGVVFIDGERLIYWVRDTNGNFLTRLFRGTMGTGAKTSYPTGTKLVDATVNQALPQRDTFTLKTFVGDGSTTAFALGFNATSTREFEVVLGGSVLEQDAWTIASGTSTLTLNTAPVSGRLLRVLRKTGHIFYTAGSGTASDGVSLTRNTSETARFLRKGTTDLP